MAQQTINIGATPNDGTGDTPRVGGDKINDNFTELYAADVSILASLDTKLSTQLFPLVTETTTARTLVLTDAQKYIRCTNGSPVSVTVPTQASVAWVAGTEILIEQAGAGQVTIVAADGVVVRTSQTLLSAAQYSQLTLKRVAENEWVCGGDREAV